MKKMNKKTLVLLIAIAALMTASIGGTVAWLATSSGPITNTFTPAHVSVSVTDEIDGNTKKNVQITNTSDIPVYMRVAVVANWYDDAGNIVAPWTNNLGTLSGWTLKDDGYYYYNSKLAVGDRTPNLLETAIEQLSPLPEGVPVGSSLQIVVLHQSIQADGGAKDAINAWNN